MKALIVGGGMGGLTTALCLHEIGFEARVFESVETIRPLGVGINLLPHAVRVLDKLGLLPRLAAAAVATAELMYFNKFGQLIWREPRGLAAGYAWPQLSIHRGRLQAVLLDEVRRRLGTASVRTGCHLAGFEDRGREVFARFVNRKSGATTVSDTGDLLVGADGIHSCVRATFFPDEGAPRSAGKMLWRATTEAAPFLTGRSMIMAGHAAQKFVAYPICPVVAAQGRSLINWIAELAVGTNLPDRRDWNRRGSKADFASAFAAWRFDWLDVPALIEGAVRRSSSFPWSIATRWTAGVSAALPFWVTPLTRCTRSAPTGLPRPFLTRSACGVPRGHGRNCGCPPAVRVRTIASHGRCRAEQSGHGTRSRHANSGRAGAGRVQPTRGRDFADGTGVGGGTL